MAEKQLLFSLGPKDFIIEWYNSTGPGGQNKNKVKACCRIKHPASGAMATGQEERSRAQNQKNAFKRLIDSEKFQKWFKIEIARRSGQMAEIEQTVKKMLDPKNLKIEGKNSKGLWDFDAFSEEEDEC